MKNKKAIALVFFLLCLEGLIHAETPQIEMIPKRVMVKLGEQVTVMCRAGEATEYCRITTPFGKVLILAPSRDPREGYSYAGAGLENGQCGFKIDHVGEQNNGIHGCSMGFSEEVSANMTLVVARPPSGLPDLSVEFNTMGMTQSTGALQENEILKVFCKVRDSRPAANITWLLDGNQVLEGLSPVVLEPSNCNEEASLCTASQNLTTSVTWKDNGKQLACVMNHLALASEAQNQTIYQLNVQYKPRDDETSAEQHSFEIGKTGIVTKQVYANPKPTFQWNIGGVWLNEGNKSDRYRADAAVNKGQGVWYAALHIDSLTASDVEKIYQLRTTNRVGSTDFQVSILAMDVPAGATLDAGAIVAVVASVLVVLIIIFLVIFAQRTGRWCFSHSEANVTNKSDIVGPGINPYEQLKKTKLSLPGIFIKKKDKVADDSEELKGNIVSAIQIPSAQKEEHDIVYAELDLQVTQPPIVRTVDDKTEYAEIIHTKKKSNSKN